jgi:TM2 domain-containing membrane protein YozV
MSESPYQPPPSNDPTLPYQTPPGYQYQQPTYPQQGYQQQGYPQAGYPQPQPQYGYPGGAPYPAVPQVDQWGRPLSDKSKLVAGLLGIFLGGFGVGRFYTGHTQIAVLQLVVTLVTCGIGHFWGLIDGIMILINGGTDAQGRILRDS